MNVAGASGGGEVSRRTVSERASQAAYFGVLTLLAVASAGATIAWSASMSAMGEMPMPGGWTMSMAWMRMPGQTWSDAGGSFLGMWVVMMMAMMLPSLAPVLLRYREAFSRAGKPRPGRLTMLLALAYFLVWTICGMAAFSVGVASSTVVMPRPMLARAVPIAAGVVVLLAGALQFTAWKAHHLACSRDVPRGDDTPSPDARTAWRLGLRMGVHCSQCCVGLMAILLVVGIMDLRAMAIVTVAVTAERLAPSGERVARILGAVIVGAGVFTIARAAGAG
jgi:predicted metal-binding membrane protein